MKYVKLIVEKDGVEMVLPVIFPNALVHSVVAEKLKEAALEHWPSHNVTVESAGDIRLEKFYVGGKSDTLGVKSLREDPEEILFCDVKQFRF